MIGPEDEALRALNAAQASIRGGAVEANGPVGAALDAVEGVVDNLRIALEAHREAAIQRGEEEFPPITPREWSNLTQMRARITDLHESLSASEEGELSEADAENAEALERRFFEVLDALDLVILEVYPDIETDND